MKSNVDDVRCPTIKCLQLIRPFRLQVNGLTANELGLWLIGPLGEMVGSYVPTSVISIPCDGDTWYHEFAAFGKTMLFEHYDHYTRFREVVNDKYHGMERQWTRTGSLVLEQRWNNGLIHGDARMWYDNRRRHVFRQYRNGKQHGRERVWNINGLILTDNEWQNDQFVRSLTTTRW